MAPLTAEQSKIRKAKKVIKDFRAQEGGLRDEASSRSTGIRNAYKGGYETLAKVEEILAKK
jgi:hypothetical protein